MPTFSKPALAPLMAISLALLVSVPAFGADQDGDLLRDSFEAKWGISDPAVADSDGDGVIDSAEDSDGDRLSDLGEQRFGTNPGRRDSDGDGQSDANEDKDRNGKSNLLEQDRRAIPAGLRPLLSKARKDFPPRHSMCQTGQGKSNVQACKFGDTRGDATIAIFGDSHAAQWIAALDRAGKEEGWQIVQLTKGGCPSIWANVAAQYRYDRNRTCKAWRSNAVAWIRSHQPDVVIVSNRGLWTLVNAKGRNIAKSKRPGVWRKALTRTLDKMPDSAALVVLSDTPQMKGEPVVCLKKQRADISACATRRSAAQASPMRKAERLAAKAGGATTRNLNDKICSYDPCPLIQGRVLAWRDHGHLTATFSTLLWPTLRDRLRSAASGALDPAAAPE